MAYCATITFHDETGAALYTIRQGAVPRIDPLDLCDRLLADAIAILQQRPDLRVVLRSDGAPELRDLLRNTLDEATLGTKVYELLDFWHLLEKLAPAAQVVYGETRAADVLTRWRMDLLNRHAAADEIHTALSTSRKRDVRIAGTRPVHEAISYLENHRERLGYPRTADGTPHRQRQHRSDLQDLQDVDHGAHEALRRTMEGSHRCGCHQPASAGTQ
jgi:hypothetical protein